MSQQCDAYHTSRLYNIHILDKTNNTKINSMQSMFMVLFRTFLCANNSRIATKVREGARALFSRCVSSYLLQLERSPSYLREVTIQLTRRKAKCSLL